MYWHIPKIWDGETCFIIGGGPSLKLAAGLDKEEEDHNLIFKEISNLLLPIHDRKVIGVNDAFRLGSWIDVCFFGDCRWFAVWEKQVLNFPGLKVTCCDKGKDVPGVRTLLRGRKGLETSPKHISWNANSGASAINLAVLFGATTIILIGFDMGILDSKITNWHFKHDAFRTNRGLAPEKEKQTYKRFRNGFEAIAVALKGRNSSIKIINANIDSKMDCFLKITLEEGLSYK